MPVSGGGDYGKNYAHNPKPVNTNYVFTFGGATATFSTARSFSGTGSFFLTLPAGGSVDWRASADDDADISPISGTVSMGVRASGASLAGLMIRPRLNYTDGSADVGTYQALVSEPSFFGTNVLPGLVKNPAKTLRNAMVTIQNPTGSSITVYVGGLDIRVDDVIDSFIHGDGPINYSWTGTPNDSPSVRSAIAGTIVRGGGGSFRPTVNVSVVNRRKQFIRDVTNHFQDGSVTYDLDADASKGSCSISLDDPGLIDPLADQYFDINVEIEYADGTTDDFPVGMFLADPPQERWDGGNDSWTYPGRDMLGLLDTTMMRSKPLNTDVGEGGNFTDARVLPVNANLALFLSEVLVNFGGVTTSQFSLPVPGVSLVGKSWPGGTTVLQCISDVLQGAAWRKPWVTPAGIIVSAKAGDDPSLFLPDATFSTGQDSYVRWPFEVDSDASGIGNRVRVIGSNKLVNTNVVTNPAYAGWIAAINKAKKNKNKKKKKKQLHKLYATPQDPKTNKDDITTYTNIAVVVANQDPASPVSYTTLGRWIDLPDIEQKVLSSAVDGNNQAAGDAKARDLGTQALIEASMLAIKARMTTEIHRRGLNEVYLLDLYDVNDDPFPSGQGKYFCRGWSFQLGPPWQMVHNLSRIIPFGAASF